MNENLTSRMNCDRIAPYYEFLEHLSFGKSLERRRCAFLRETQTSKRAIVCGGGDGRFLARLLRTNSRVLVDFVDLSPGMIELAERRVAAMGPAYRARVRFYVGDVGEFQAQPKCYDLIVTNFFLDCFSETELSTIVARLAGWGAERTLACFRLQRSGRSNRPSLDIQYYKRTLCGI
jgi:ubiquinone/menaquinone biosynthesis C-methylase UbiE